jgi:acyl-CoA synthetase (AMP-forming)/AMP-acid ligase II
VASAPIDAIGALPAVAESVPASLLYTSGTTTGRPKAVPFTSEMLATMVDYTEMFGVSPRDRCIFVTPLFHGNANGAWMSALLYGASAVFPRRFSARAFWPLVDTYRPTYLFTLSPIVNILMSLPPSPIERSSSLRLFIALGAAAGAPAIEARYGVPIIDWYGMTEAGTGTYTRLGDERRPGSAGRPFPGSSMRILRPDGREADIGEVGEVAFRLDGIGFTGYVEDPEATAAAIKGDWFMTGDLGRFDADGFFYFVDRQKDIVRRGGENISTIEVETVLRGHPQVADVAVIGAADDVMGERIVAVVVPVQRDDPPELIALRNAAAAQLASFKLPDEIMIVDELPRTATGKVEKFRLRERLRAAATE